MAGRSNIFALVLLMGGALFSVGLSSPSRAATSPTRDVLSDDQATDASSNVDFGAVKPLARPTREPAKIVPSGNPIWSVPLSVLSATQERPIFSTSRRPPQRAVIAPSAQVAAPPPPPVEPDRPALALIGAVVGESDAIAVFLDRASQKIIRLRQGESHAGWQLSSVQGREVTFKKADRTEVFALQRQGAPAGVPGGVLPMPAPQPVSGVADGANAPFVPRSTPKNGGSDGL